MKRIAFYDSCTFSYTVIHTILCNIDSSSFITKTDSKLEPIAADFVIYVISKYDLLQRNESFLEHFKHLPDERIIVIGEIELYKLFNAVAGCQYKNIDIAASTENLMIKSKALKFENKVGVQMDGLKNSKVFTRERNYTNALGKFFIGTKCRVTKRNLKVLSQHKCSFYRKLGFENRAYNLLETADDKIDTLTFTSAFKGINCREVKGSSGGYAAI